MNEQNIDFNYSECIKSYDSWGKTTYKNICTQETNTIPWGVGGYLGFSGTIILFLIGIAFFIMIIRMIFDY